MNGWRDRRRTARWETMERGRAADAAKALAVELHRGDPPPVQPYTVGLVLWEGEQTWVEVTARCSADSTVPAGQGHDREPPVPPLTAWLVTSHRVAGRSRNGTVQWWRWAGIVGVRVDLTPRRELVQLDPGGQTPVWWTGAGIPPLAVAAIYHLHGPAALIDHPGLAVLRTAADHRARTAAHTELPASPRDPT